MSKFKDEIAQKLFQHLNKNLEPEIKAQLPPTLITEIIYSIADYIAIDRTNMIFDQAIELHKALVESQKEDESEEHDESFMSELKKL